MRIRIVAVGKIKEDYIQKGIEDYLGRIRRYFTVEEVEVKGSKKAPAAAIEEEGGQLLRKLEGSTCTVVLTPEGRELTTEALAGEIENLMHRGHRRLDFVIGGHEGISIEVKNRADLLLSISRLTFPYQLTRLLLAEQLYRCTKIIRGEKYHR